MSANQPMQTEPTTEQRIIRRAIDDLSIEQQDKELMPALIRCFQQFEQDKPGTAAMIEARAGEQEAA